MKAGFTAGRVAFARTEAILHRIKLDSAHYYMEPIDKKLYVVTYKSLCAFDASKFFE